MGKNDCTEHLLKNICDNNVMEVWLGAKQLEIESLASTAINHLVDRPRGKSLTDVPGFKEALQSDDKSLKYLLDVMTDNDYCRKEENLSLKEELTQLKAKLEGSGFFKVTVKKTSVVSLSDVWTEDFYVRPKDMVSTVLKEVEKRRGKPAVPYRRWALAGGSEALDFSAFALDENTSFESNGISNNSSPLAWPRLR